MFELFLFIVAIIQHHEREYNDFRILEDSVSVESSYRHKVSHVCNVHKQSMTKKAISIALC